MTYQKVKPLQAKDISLIRTLVDKPLPTVPVEVVEEKEKLSFLNKVQEYYHTASVLIMGLILYLIDYAPQISTLLDEKWQTRLSIATVILTLVFNYFKSNAQWIKQRVEADGQGKLDPTLDEER